MKSKPNNSKKVNYTAKYCAKRYDKNKRTDLTQQNPKAAGIDIGAKEIVVAVPREKGQFDVWMFDTFTKDLKDIVALLKKFDVDCAAMESTGNYWVPIYEMLQESGIRPYLANAKNIKNVSGKKTDVSDAEWLATLLKYGLISGAFRPTDTLKLRGFIRQRALLIEHRSPHILHMDKALIEMNLRLSNVISDVVGLTGLSIIHAIIRGERDPKKLAALRHERCKNSAEIIEMSLEGHYKEEQVFALKQAVEAYEFYQRQIDECEREIEKAMNELQDITEETNSNSSEDSLQTSITTKITKEKKKKRNNSKNAYKFDAHSLLHKKAGVDLTRIGGLSEQNVWLILSEVGMNVSPWATDKHFSSWLALCPNNMISGGKILKSRTKRSQQRARQAFILAAYSLHSSKCALGAYYRRMRAKHGPEKAIVATAHKLARLFYRTLKYGTEYIDQGQEEYERQYRERTLKAMQRKAADMGYTLVPSEKIA